MQPLVEKYNMGALNLQDRKMTDNITRGYAKNKTMTVL